MELRSCPYQVGARSLDHVSCLALAVEEVVEVLWSQELAASQVEEAAVDLQSQSRAYRGQHQEVEVGEHFQIQILA